MMSTELTYRSRAVTRVKELDGVGQGCHLATARPLHAMLLAIAGGGALSGCISVNAPDKPIVIELNMNITMDVVYKLSSDATKTVDTNKDIF